ncbi:FMN reductase [Zoogloea sp.]|uniref:FMN reductase n=1 Tax=Zoogloea sp. TaxID=49181 RepID=UPI0025EBD0CB|nr:FMN reductase [Zoogloea sp.]MCK6394787.1 FMN reductase [Zoogloea sp.]
MSNKPKVVAVSGGLYKPSRTRVLVDEIVATLGHHKAIDLHLIDLADLASELGGVVNPADLPSHIAAHIHAIETADVLVVGSPVYRATYTGLFKHLFDFVHHESLIDVPVLLAATGGSERHALVLDHQLRPLFSFFQAVTLPIGVYASEADFENYRVASDSLRARIDLAIQRALPFVNKRRQPETAALAA